MKKAFLLGLMIVALGLTKVNAQVSVNVSIGTPPMWAPYGYTEARYYYLPDVACYYDVIESRFIYNNGHAWVRVSSLPSRYRGYDLYSGYKVVLDYAGPSPYIHFSMHRDRYPRGYCGPRQITYREYHRHEHYYREIPPGHWKNGKWKEYKHSRGRERDWDDDDDHHHHRGHGRHH